MDYKTTVGIEVHMEVKSKTKMFSDSVNGYGLLANSNINIIDLGYPGALPTVNMGVIEKALRAAIVLNCKINKVMHFDRKNYFYPDLPKGYQITQARTPIGVDGFVEIEVDGKPKKIRIHDIHIEEDTAKSMHSGNHSLLDFNRAGVPLIEIVTEPDMTDGKEAMIYLEKLRELLFYTDVSDCKIEEGSMRCDVNVSVSKTEVLGTRTEVKNIGSISNVGICVEKETKRQIEKLENGGTIVEETRRFDEGKQETILMRVKETGNDYRYFPEPDIPFVEITEDYIEGVKNDLPILPSERRKAYIDGGISTINADKIIQNRSISDYLLEVGSINLVIASNLLLGDILAYLNKNNVSIFDTKLNIEKFETLVNMLDKEEITNKIFKEILVDLLESDEDIKQIIERKGLKTISDVGELLNTVQMVISNNSDSVKDFKEGRERAVKFLMGQIMKETKGQANAGLVNTLLIEELKKQ